VHSGIVTEALDDSVPCLSIIRSADPDPGRPRQVVSDDLSHHLPGPVVSRAATASAKLVASLGQTAL